MYSLNDSLPRMHAVPGRTCRLYGHNQILLVLPSVLVAGGNARFTVNERVLCCTTHNTLRLWTTTRCLGAFWLQGVGRVKSGEYGFREEGNP